MLMILISIKNHKEAQLPELAVSSSILIGQSCADEKAQLHFAAEASVLDETVRSTINPDHQGGELPFDSDVAPFNLDKDLQALDVDQEPAASGHLNLSAD